ncbi:von Willebrand factor A domain-containing protein 8 [Gonapodya sp. JEL0774]|nr:von Willebrand factor A domain-containing protein 8 [Gonapodya sp. JEL0774]
MPKVRAPELVPDYLQPLYESSQEILRHLRWIMQKDVLGQDIFLLGPPGSFRRSLAIRYASLTRREIEYVPLSKDVTDGDLKQRREIAGGTAYYLDQACVRAATEGRILILDGIEKAERNVLPIINNLLENREMALEDGRFLVHPKRYDTLIRQQTKGDLDRFKLVRVSERFLVVALGVPVPRYEGYPLDPPLRSRFQSRSIPHPSFANQVAHLAGSVAPSVAKRTLERLVSVATVVRTLPRESTTVVPEFPATTEQAARVLHMFPKVRERFVLDLCYPFTILEGWETEKRNVVETAYQRFGFLGDAQGTTGTTDDASEDPAYGQLEPGYRVVSFIKLAPTKLVSGLLAHRAAVTFVSLKDDSTVTVEVPAGPDASTASEGFVQTEYHAAMVASMVVSHAASGDFCVMGEKGAGKSALVREFARRLGYRVEFIPLYKDMSARDLLQRRSTTLTGDTIWESSPLVKAALNGSLALLDSADSVMPQTLTTIGRLLSEREIQLPDGTLLVHPERYARLMQHNGWSVDDLEKRRVFSIHPSFRIVALARPNSRWLSEETTSLWTWIVLRGLKFQEEMHLIHTVCPDADQERLSLLVKFADQLRNDKDDVVKQLSGSLSTRQLLRIARRISAFPDESLFTAIHKVALSRFLPSLAKQALDAILEKNGIVAPPTLEDRDAIEIQQIPSENPQVLRIGNIEHPVAQDTNPLLIPDLVFYENPKQTEILREMLKDWKLGEQLLLIGNQGVGKNKLTDKFLQLLKLPREYMQLHRDTTVQSLTSTPSIVDGVLQYEDSSLVRACREGYILVVDEADKAPTHVTAILKTLVEDGEMVLSDGRRIVSRLPMESPAAAGVANDSEREEYILIHPAFRMIVLANRPGFPFLGNDFYREIGDVFSSHSIDNPDMDSELAMLRKYAPHVPEDVLVKLTMAFNDLRRLVDEGLISYPYSTRELVNIVKHLETFPQEGLSRAVRNVFDFDQFDPETKELLIETLQKNGIPAGMESDFRMELGVDVKLSEPILLESWLKRPSGKVDKKTCEVESREISSRGGWPIIPSKDIAELERTEMRSITFSEQIYSFKIPTKGEALDVYAADDGTIYCITTSPVTLHIVAPDHRRLLGSIDLYEYFPLQKGQLARDIEEFNERMASHPAAFINSAVAGRPTVRIRRKSSMSLKIAMLGRTNLVLHNPVEHTLLILDLAENKIVSVIVPGLEPQPTSTMVKALASEGVLILFQEAKSTIVILDFAEGMQFIMKLPIRIANIFPVKKDAWLIQSYDFTFDKRATYLLTCGPDATEDMWVPTIIETVEVRNSRGQAKVAEVLHMSNDIHDSAHGSIRFLATKEYENMTTISPSFSGPWDSPDGGKIELFGYDRDSRHNIVNKFLNLRTSHVGLEKTGQMASVVPTEDGRNEGFLEIHNVRERRLRRIKIPLTIPVSIMHETNVPTSGMYGRAPTDSARQVVSMAELPNGALLTMDLAGLFAGFGGSAIANALTCSQYPQGVARVWQVKYEDLVRDANTWKRLVGSLDEKVLKVIYQGQEGDDEGEGDGMGGKGKGEGEGEGEGEGKGEGKGKGDGEGEGGGGGSGSGGEPGQDETAREAGTIDANFNMRSGDDAQPQELSDAQKELHSLAMRKRLQQLDMTEQQMEMYTKYLSNVQRQVREIRVVLESVEAKNKERVWLKNQSTGDVDDTKLIEGLTGERAIYKRRGETDEIGIIQQKPKKIIFAFDLSASMMRFNGHDQRLDRSLEVALMIMESFKGFEKKFEYKILGHSGDAPNMPFVIPGEYPTNEKEMFMAIRYCHRNVLDCSLRMRN